MAETSVYESARMTHEEIEQYEDALVNTLNNPPRASSHRLQMQWQLASSQLLDQIVTRYDALQGMYEDASGERAREWEALAGDVDDEDGAMAKFYARLEHLQAYYQKYPERAISLETTATPSILGAQDASLFDFSIMEREFSGEEMGGRFLDLYEPYEMFINLRNVPRISYLEYLAQLDAMMSVPLATKRSEAYKLYLTRLREYLSAFLHKTRPLEDMDAPEAAALRAFEDDWEQGRVPGWEKKEAALYGTGNSESGIWCDACQRFYAKQTVYDAHLSSARHLKAVRRLQSGEQPAAPQPRENDTEQKKHAQRAKQIARDEVLVRALATELASVRDETRANIERKASLTEREREEEVEAMEAEMDEAMETGGMGYEDAGDDAEGGGGEKTYNPLKLPIGWDGKPIPFWMYKLHGLRVEYRCEICSDHVYKGRKVFEKHFQESRHAFGMRALGLPNTPEFRDVTRIQDAFALAEKLRQQKRLQDVEEDDTIEVEDEHGNKYHVARQGGQTTRTRRLDHVVVARADMGAQQLEPSAAPASMADSRSSGSRQSNKKRAQSLNHLLAFTLPPREPPATAPRRPRRHDGLRPFSRELKPSFDSRRHMQDPDLPLPWQDILQVLVPFTSDTYMRQGKSSSALSLDSTQATTCPICLSPPTAPRMTRCGHVYCYACILHYLTVSENGKGTRGVQRYVKRCPVCWDDVMARDLKSVRWIDAQSVAGLHMATFLDGRGKVDDMDDILTLRLMERPHDSVIALPRSPHWPIDTSMGLACTQPDALVFARCVLASRSLMTSSLEADMTSVEKDMSPPHASLLDELSLEFLRVAHAQLTEQWEQAQALPESVGTQCMPDEHRHGMSYFYYQAASGQNVFIHPIDIKVLLSRFGTYAAFPDTLMVVVEHAEEGTVDESLRKRCKYMAHLPMSADVTFVEIDWARTSSMLGPIQGDIPWKSWSSTLAQRRQRHHQKATKEERARIRADKGTKNALLKSSSGRGSASEAASDASGMSFRESAMVGAEMYFPIHPGRVTDDPDVVFPSVTSHTPNLVPNDGPRTVWGTPATGTMPLPSQGARDVDEAWNALEAHARDDVSMPPAGTKQRPRRKPKLILTAGGRGAL